MLVGLLAATVSTVVSAATTPAVRFFARRAGAVDRPGGRRVHKVETPRMGGVAIVVAYVAAVGAVWLSGALQERLPDEGRALLGFLAGGTVIALLGAFDDLKSLGAKKKLAGQVLAASVAWLAGCRIGPELTLPLVGELDVGLVASLGLSVFWIVGFINAINLIDGLDGLAAGIVFFACLTNLVVAIVSDNLLALVLNASLAGAVVGFLAYNFNPATIFMGDTGSMFLGYALGAAALLSGRQKESTLVSLLVPIIALGLPFADTIVSMLRRMLSRRSIFAADRGHLHHRLIDVGLTHRGAVLVLYGCSVMLCLAATAVAFGREWHVGAAIVAAIIVLVGVLRFAGAFDMAMHARSGERRRLVEELGALRRGVPRAIVALHDASSMRAALAALQDALGDDSIKSARLTGPDGALLWDWESSGAKVGTEKGKSQELKYPVRLSAGDAEATLAVVVRSTAGRAPLAADGVLLLVADALEGALLRVYVEERSVAPERRSEAGLRADGSA